MTTLKVSSPAELISAVPFLIGFHPVDSLTVVGMHGPRITFAVRIDLPEDGTPDEEAEAAVLHLAAVVLHQQVEAVAILGYGEESRVTPAVSRISGAFRKAALAIVDELRVEDGRYWSYLCTELSCCPPEGQPCQPPNSVVAAEATFAGAVALPNREALEAQLAPVTGDDREAMTTATARALLRLAALASERPPPPAPDPDPAPGGRSGQPGADRVAPAVPAEEVRSSTAPGPCYPGSVEAHLGSVIGARLGIVLPPVPDAPAPVAGSADPLSDEDCFLALVRRAGRLAVREAERCYSTGGRLTDEAAAWLGVLLLHMPIRDYAWTRTKTQEWELALWSDLTRRVEPRYLPAPAALLAFVAWRSGQGPLASIAVERILDQKPGYPLAVLLQRALIIGLPPSVLDGWPAVAGMAPVDDGPDSEEEARHDEVVSPEQTRGSEPHRPAKNGGPGRSPARRRAAQP